MRGLAGGGLALFVVLSAISAGLSILLIAGVEILKRRKSSSSQRRALRIA